jgi:hypothetical protein
MQHTAPKQCKLLGATVRGLGVVVAVSHEATGIAELVGFYRLARDMCARGGLPDWGEMVFTLECEFQSVRVLSDEQHKSVTSRIRRP